MSFPGIFQEFAVAAVTNQGFIASLELVAQGGDDKFTVTGVFPGLR
jgi:hypothetical protein